MTSGDAMVQGSLHSKLSSILGSLLITQEICSMYQIRMNNVKLRCDGLGKINILNNMHKSTNNARKHFDLIESIWKTLTGGNTN
jgi:hypothetical protein